MKRLAALVVLVIVTAAACVEADLGVSSERVGPEAKFAEGVGTAGAWSAWVYRIATGDLCLELRLDGLVHDARCASAAGPFVTVETSGTEAIAYILGSTSRPAAEVVSIQLATDPGGWLSVYGVASAPAEVAQGVGLYAAELPRGAQVAAVEIYDAAGSQIGVDELPR